MEKKVNGSTTGIRQTLLDKIASMYDLRMENNEFASSELLEMMASFTGSINREISVYISRDGQIVDVSVGDASTVSMPSMRLVRNEDRLCGVRCIHTHPNGSGRLSGVDLGTLRSMRLDCMAAVGVTDGKPVNLFAAYVGEFVDDRYTALIFGPLRPYHLPHKALMSEIYIADSKLKSTTTDVTESQPERAILVGIDIDEGYDTIEELSQLAKTAGANVVSRFVQRARNIDNATYIGSGKAEELSQLCSELEADIVIFDHELSAMQIRNLEETIGTRVVDRTALILDIFAGRATTREGRLQVELAQLKYRLPRLLGQGVALSRLGGGIGTRGPGEKKLEIDKRRINRKIFELEQELAEISKQRMLRRERRDKNSIPLVALVGYTNAGKSTLLNALSDAKVLAEDKLFATLDPVVRNVTLPHGTEILLSDTVGFINKLPHDLIQAFRSTLEEVSSADLILHVVDASSEYYEKQMEVVSDVLEKLDALNIPSFIVYNKSDAIDGTFNAANGISISALNKTNIDELLEKIEKELTGSLQETEVFVPYTKYDAVSTIRELGRIISEEHKDDGTLFNVLLDERAAATINRALGN